jgi:hypothetical protein
MDGTCCAAGQHLCSRVNPDRTQMNCPFIQQGIVIITPADRGVCRALVHASIKSKG